MIELKKISQEELDEILRLHQLWTESEGKEGKKADLSYTDLEGLGGFSYADLAEVNFEGADCTGVFFYGSYLSKANFNRANVKNACFNGTYLNGASFINSNLGEADTRWVQFGHMILTQEDLINKDKINHYSKVEFHSSIIMD